MQCFHLPNVITDQVDRLSREFFWKMNNIEKGLPLIAWDRVCRPKDRGGIGLHKTAAVNITFQCKLAWNVLTNNESLWAKCMWHKYLSQDDYFQYKKRKPILMHGKML